jgi:hypothetical protein
MRNGIAPEPYLTYIYRIAKEAITGFGFFTDYVEDGVDKQVQRLLQCRA